MHPNALAKRFIAARERIAAETAKLAELFIIEQPASEFDARALRDPDIRHLDELQRIAGVLEQAVVQLDKQQQEAISERLKASAAPAGLRVVGGKRA